MTAAGAKREKEAVGPQGTVRCAVYTRKSTEKGLEQEFNSLDAQREAADAYITSQKHKGWVSLPERYDDGGFSGGTMDRPALKRLLADVEAGRVDCIVFYRIDRLSRSLVDFARIAEILEQREVPFASVTELIDTSTSTGRLMLNVILSFAQFEREVIAERTRDKMSAARRKGKWVGGMPTLGFDVDPGGGRLVVNDAEEKRPQAIFEIYWERRSLIATIRELNRRGWTTKRWVTKKGQERGGRPFDKARLLYLLRNPVYIGRVRYQGTLYPGEHQAIVDEKLWHQVQELLNRNGATRGGAFRNEHGALLKSLLYCAPCGRAMTHSYTAKGSKRYRYYVCTRAQKQGWASCPSKSVPAGEIERFVVDRLRAIGSDRALVARVLEEAGAANQRRADELERERQDIEREMRRCASEVRKLVGQIGAERAGGGESPVTARLADLQERIRAAEERVLAIRREITALEAERIDDEDLAAALEGFDSVWEVLSPREQARIVQLLVARVAYDGAKGTVAVTFRPSGIKALAEEELA